MKANLKTVIENIIFISNEKQERRIILPQGKAVLGLQLKGSLAIERENGLFSLDKIGITGFQEEARRYISAPDTFTVLIHFTSYGLRAFSSESAQTIANQSLSLQDISISTGSLMDQLYEARTNQNQMRSILEAFILSRCLKTNISYDHYILAALKKIHFYKGRIRIAKLAKELDLSVRQLERKFLEWIGVSPFAYAHVVKMQSLLKNIEKTHCWNDLVEEGGFFDQSHFIKAFKKFTNYTPKQFQSIFYNSQTKIQ